MSNRISRFWGAVLVDGQPRAEVRDVTDAETLTETLHNRVVPEFRWFRVSDLEHADGDDCTGGILCEPGAPCPACITAAVGFWYEHARRTERRIYRAASLKARDRTNGWDSRDYCDCKKHPTEAAAVKCAGKKGLPLVVEMNGHGSKLRWISVGLFALAVSP